MPNDLELKRAEGMVFVRCEKISAPVLECDFGLGTERITSRLMATVADEKDKLIIDAIMDCAKRNGITDLFLIDEEFVRSAIIHEAERRATMNELKLEDVMSALEKCVDGECCNECPYFEKENCLTKLHTDALALLREKDAEIERLRKAKYIYSTVDYCADDFAKAQEEIERLRNALAISREKTKRYMTSHKQIREETIDEFANKVCECRHESSPIVIAVRCAAREMKEEQDA